MSVRHHRPSGSRPRGGKLTNTLAVLFCLVWIFPVYWMLNTAFKPRSEAMTPTPHFWPHTPTLRNFDVAINQTGFVSNLVNSLIVVAAAVVLAVLLGMFAAAALTRFRFRGRMDDHGVGPHRADAAGHRAAHPDLPDLQRDRTAGHLRRLVFAYVATVLPFSIWVMRGFFITIPVEVEEAARIDGASTWQVLTRVLFPLVAPGVIASSIFAFITAWNDYLIAYTFMKAQDQYTLPVWLASFSTPTGTDFGGQMAGSVIFSLPVVVFFLIIQRKLVTGMSAGAVKG